MAIPFKNDDLTHIVRTTEQWETTVDKYEIIPEGVLCVEFTPSDKTNIKIGNGHKTFRELPYVAGNIDLSLYYTREETDNRILSILNEQKVFRIKGYKKSFNELPANGAEGDVWFVESTSPSEFNIYEKYIWTANNKWEFIGNSNIDIDLSQYAKKEYVESKFNDINLKLQEWVDTEKVHTHLNKEILDKTDAVFDKVKDDKLASLSNYDDKEIRSKITNLEKTAHTHQNKDTLDKITAPFTIEYERLMPFIREYVGASRFEDGEMGLVPPALAGEQDYILTGAGKWVPNTGGGVYELPPATSETLGGVIIGDGINVDENGIISVEAPADLKTGDGLEIVTISDEAGYNNLPDGYGKISYIESLQGQYTIIDYIPKESTRVVVEYSYEAVADGNQPLFGSRDGSTSGGRQFVLWMEWESSGPYTGFIYGGNSWNGTDVPYEGYPLTCEFGQKMTADVSVNGYYLDGKLIHSVTNTGTPSPYKLAIFHVANSDTTVESNKTAFKGRIYSFKIYENDVLVVDLVPVVVTSLNTPGFYDVINNNFYQSAISTSFTYDASSVIISGEKQINLLPATTDSIGGVIVGDGLSITEDGVISVDVKPLEPATSETLGGVKIGEGLTVQEDGTISVDGAAVYNAGEGISITKRSRKLPVEYQEIEYIESNGSAIFDTGYLVNQATIIEMDCIVYKSTNSDWQFLYGSRVSAAATDTEFGFVVRHYHKGYVPELWLPNGEQIGTSSPFPYDERTIIKQNMNDVTWYPVSTGVPVTITGTVSLSTSSTTLAVSGFKDGSTYTFGPKCQIYKLKISDINGVVRDYIPCYRVSDGVVGLYDLVNETFRYNATSTAFTSGPIVSNSDGDSTEEDTKLYINNEGLIDAKVKEDAVGVVTMIKRDNNAKDLDVFQYLTELQINCIED